MPLRTIAPAAWGRLTSERHKRKENVDGYWNTYHQGVVWFGYRGPWHPETVNLVRRLRNQTNGRILRKYRIPSRSRICGGCRVERNEGRGVAYRGTVYTVRRRCCPVGDACRDGQRSLEERILCDRQRD